MSSLIGSSFGNYRLDALVGTGTVGQVFRATQTQLGTHVAIKVFHRELTADSIFKSRFLQLAQTVTLLNHPNIAKTFHFLEHDGYFCIVMELLSGGSMEIRASSQASGDWNRTFWADVELVQQAIDGVAAAHAKGVVHGGIKPSNLLLGQNETGAPVTKVQDFGVAQLFRETRSGGDIVVNSGYLAPEQQQGSAPDARSDVYSLGAILYEMTTRRPAFRAQAAPGARGAAVVPPRQLMGQFPEALERVIIQCLEPNPDQRFRSSTELSEALQLVIHHREAPGSSIPKAAPMRTTAPAPPPKLNSPVPCLHILDPEGTRLDVRYLGGSSISIGSGTDNDIILRSSQVSPRHAQIDWDGMRVTVTDFGSDTGTRVKGIGLLPHVPQEWVSDQWLSIGPFWIWLEQASRIGPDPLIEVLLDAAGKNMTLAPGKPAVCRLTVVNRKQQVDDVSITVEGFPQEWIENSGQSVRLQPFDKKVIELKINVPKEPTSRGGDYPVRVRANSRINPALEQGSDDAAWVVSSFQAMTLNITPSKAGARRQARYNVAVRHDGNTPASCVLTAQHDDKQLEFAFATDRLSDRGRLQLDLQPGTSSAVKLKITAPKRWVGAAVTTPFTVNGAEGTNVHTVEAQFIHKAVFPAWSLALVPIVLGALVFLVLYMGKPTVQKFVTEPRGQAKAGDLVTVVWEAPYATRIKLTQDQNQIDVPNESEGKYEFRIDHDTMLEMTASNIFGTSPVARAAIRVRAKDAAAPAIVDMTVSPLKITKGQTVMIRWKVAGGKRAESSWMGTVDLEGSFTDTPDSPRVYSITGYNEDNLPTKKEFSVAVDAVGPMVKPVLTRTDNKKKPNVGDWVMFSWDARNAQSLRIVGAGSTVQVEGSTGQKRAQLKAKGIYSFILIAKDANGNEVQSEPVVFEAFCTVKNSFRCKDVPEVQWN